MHRAALKTHTQVILQMAYVLFCLEFLPSLGVYPVFLHLGVTQAYMITISIASNVHTPTWRITDWHVEKLSHSFLPLHLSGSTPEGRQSGENEVTHKWLPADCEVLVACMCPFPDTMTKLCHIVTWGRGGGRECACVYGGRGVRWEREKWSRYVTAHSAGTYGMASHSSLPKQSPLVFKTKFVNLQPATARLHLVLHWFWNQYVPL